MCQPLIAWSGFGRRGTGLGDSDELDMARSMIRLYGDDAECVAAGHAETHADMGETAKSERWRRIAAHVLRMRISLETSKASRPA